MCNGNGEVDQSARQVESLAYAGSLTRDDDGRIVTKTETLGGVSSQYAYTYDADGRLIKATKDGAVVQLPAQRERLPDPRGERSQGDHRKGFDLFGRGQLPHRRGERVQL